MPFAINQGVRIYYEVEGAGPPLVLHHGAFGSGADWREFSYADELKRDHQLVLLDARGHGKSDKPYDPAAYDLRLRALDVVAVLDELRIGQADYLGYSMGGWIGFGLAKHAPHRFESLIIGGAHPYDDKMNSFRARLPEEPAAFVEMLAPAFGSYMSPAMRERLLANDLKALHALTQDRQSLADVLPSMRMPCLLFVGEADPRLPQVEECRKHIANATYLSLPGCDHVAGFARSDMVLPHVRRFLSQLR